MDAVMWWILGAPVLWFRQLMCRAGLHDDGERISAMHPSDHCLRCGAEFEES